MKFSKLINRFDIEIVNEISNEEHHTLARNVAKILSNKFAYIEHGYVYEKLMNAKIFIADLPEGITNAIYSYEEDTLLISMHEDISHVSEDLLYECVHAIQDVRNKKGEIKQLGQCFFSDFKVYAIALNEACVQYIVSKVFDKEDKIVDAYGIKAKTFSPNKYPLLCNLLEQMLFVSDEEKLVESTIYSNDDFIIDQMEELGEANYSNIRNNLDEMLYASEEIINSKAKLKLMGNEDEDEINKIQEKEDFINKVYMDCQMSIFTVYFNRLFKRINNSLDIKFYRARLGSFKSLLGLYANNNKPYTLDYYEEYYKNKIIELKELEIELKRKENLALVRVSDNIIARAFNRARNAILRLLNRET